MIIVNFFYATFIIEELLKFEIRLTLLFARINSIQGSDRSSQKNY